MLNFIRKLKSQILGKWDHHDSILRSTWIPASDARDILERRDESGDLSRTFFSNDGQVAVKWLHYFPIYEKHFACFRNTNFKMLEIGVYRGGSLDMWRKYFGERATIFGIDINPDCAAYANSPNEVRIGSQSDSQFLAETVREMGGLDLVLDDGSHVASHERASFETLFPLLADGGLYVIEDAHTAYWAAFEGGYKRTGTAVEIAKNMVDDMHHWYHDRDTTFAVGRQIGAVHFYDSVILIEKRTGHRPQHTQTGAKAGQLPV